MEDILKLQIVNNFDFYMLATNASNSKVFNNAKMEYKTGLKHCRISNTLQQSKQLTPKQQQ